MEEERARATFNVREMTFLIDGDEEMTRMKEAASRQLEADPLFHPRRGKHDLTRCVVTATRFGPISPFMCEHWCCDSMHRPEVRELTLERVRALWKMLYADGGSVKMREARLEVAGLLDPNWCGTSANACAWIARCNAMRRRFLFLSFPLVCPAAGTSATAFTLACSWAAS